MTSTSISLSCSFLLVILSSVFLFSNLGILLRAPIHSGSVCASYRYLLILHPSLGLNKNIYFAVICHNIHLCFEADFSAPVYENKRSGQIFPNNACEITLPVFNLAMYKMYKWRSFSPLRKLLRDHIVETINKQYF